jgi:hypothetical protein
MEDEFNVIFHAFLTFLDPEDRGNMFLLNWRAPSEQRAITTQKQEARRTTFSMTLNSSSMPA